MKPSIPAIASSILLLTASHSALAAIDYGAYAYGGDLFSGDEDGGAGSTAAAAGGSNFSAQSSLAGSGYTPVLKAESTSEGIYGPDDVTQAVAQAYQTFTSSISQTITLDLSLDAVVSSDDAGWAYALADIYVYGGDFFSIQDTYCTSGEYAFGTYVCGTKYGRANMYIGDGSMEIFDSISFDVAAGEDFAVYAILRANSNIGSADAFNTLEMAFTDDTYLAAASAVPVPAAVWLFGSGLLGLVGVARRKVNGENV